MPTVSVARDELFDRLKAYYTAQSGQTPPPETDEDFETLCFEFGVELDEITTEAEEQSKAAGTDLGTTGTTGDKVIYKIDVPANRYDLLCIEGIARSLSIFLQNVNPPTYQLTQIPEADMITMNVRPSTQKVRPFVVGAVLRNVTLDPTRYQSFIDLQDKLHQNICRRRTLVAIGTHDLDTIQGPFTYDGRAPQDIKFQPLGQSEQFRADNLLEFYRTDPSVKHIRPYVDIIADKPVYPLIVDSNDTVLSMPPIINGEHSKISVDTKNVFIECTATDLTKANTVLNMLVTMFSEYCQETFTVEPVKITYDEPNHHEGYVTPVLALREMEATVEYVESLVGVSIGRDKVLNLCYKMQLEATLGSDNNTLHVKIPPTRPDILHPCDIAEDIAIAYGYNNIPMRLPPTPSTAMQQPVNHLTDLIRNEVAHAGYLECLTFGLVSRQENYKLLREEDDQTSVALANPKTADFEIVRTTLIPGLLKCLSSNKDASVREGIKFFEISDVVVKDSSSDVGARNKRTMAAVYCGLSAGFEVIHGLADRVFQLLGVRLHPEVHEVALAGSTLASNIDKNFTGFQYYIAEDECPKYLQGRAAKIMLQRVHCGKPSEAFGIGDMGVVHPEVIENFDLGRPVSALEINLEHFV